jgi:hypothetical protein
MKILKISSLIFAISVLALFGYANLRILSVVEKLRPVQLISFDVRGEIGPGDRMQLEKKLSSVAGVTACSLSDEGNIASIIFHPEKINEETITELLSQEGKLNVSLRDLTASPGCPIHNLNSSFQEFISALDIRN